MVRVGKGSSPFVFRIPNISAGIARYKRDNGALQSIMDTKADDKHELGN